MIDTAVNFLNETTKDALWHELKKLKLAKKDVTAITKILVDPKRSPDEALVHIMNALVSRAAKGTRHRAQEDESFLSHIQPAVRALVAYENHCASRMENGHVTSRMCEHVVTEALALTDASVKESQARGRRHDTVHLYDPAALMAHFAEAYVAIEGEGRAVRASRELQATARHMLDWATYADIEIMMQSDAHTLADVALGAARLVAESLRQARGHGGTIRALSKRVADIMDMKEFTERAKQFAEAALCECNDPALMAPDVTDVPKNLTELLTPLAPCLRFRSPFAPDDVSVPSPFTL